MPPIIKPVVKLARGALREVADDPLATAIAARMTGQLEAMSPLMGLKASMNLPAAYAGDKRSLAPIQKQLRELENIAAGLPPSPSRRKFTQQAAGMAARQALPDFAGANLVKKVLTEAVAPEKTHPRVQEMLSKLRGSTDPSSGGGVPYFLQGDPEEILRSLWEENPGRYIESLDPDELINRDVYEVLHNQIIQSHDIPPGAQEQARQKLNALRDELSEGDPSPLWSESDYYNDVMFPKLYED